MSSVLYALVIRPTSPPASSRLMQIDVVRLVRVGDPTDFAAGLFEADEARHLRVARQVREDLVGDDADEQNVQACDARDVVRLHEPPVVRPEVQVGVDDREARHLLEEEEVRQAVVELVVPERYDVGGKVVHDFDRRDSAVLGVDDRPLHHVAADRVEDVLGLSTNLPDVPRQEREPSDELSLAAAHFGEEVAVHVVRVEHGQPYGSHDAASPRPPLRVSAISSARLCSPGGTGIDTV